MNLLADESLDEQIVYQLRHDGQYQVKKPSAIISASEPRFSEETRFLGSESGNCWFSCLNPTYCF